MIKLLAPVIAILFCVQILAAQIQFQSYNQDALLSRAQTEGKPIFIELYADWCGACKQLEKNYFSLASVGNVYNKQFIPTRLNAESTLGKALMEDQAIEALPTMLFMDEKGMVFHEVTGGTDEQGLAHHAKTAMMLYDITKGKSYPNLNEEQLYELLNSSVYWDDPALSVPYLQAYLKTDHWKNSDGIYLISMFAIVENQDAFLTVANNQHLIEDKGLLEELKFNVILHRWATPFNEAKETEKEPDWVALLGECQTFWKDKQEAACRLLELKVIFWSVLKEDKTVTLTLLKELNKQNAAIKNELIRALIYERIADIISIEYFDDPQATQEGIAAAHKAEPILKSAKIYSVLSELYDSVDNDEKSAYYQKMAEKAEK